MQDFDLRALIVRCFCATYVDTKLTAGLTSVGRAGPVHAIAANGWFRWRSARFRFNDDESEKPRNNLFEICCNLAEWKDASQHAHLVNFKSVLNFT